MLNKLFHVGSKTPEVSVAQTVDARSTGNPQIVDVRERNEWREGRIPGAILIPLGEIGRRANELDPSRPVITVCRSGRRSLLAADELLKRGFKDVSSMAGGMISWAQAGQPIER